MQRLSKEELTKLRDDRIEEMRRSEEQWAKWEAEQKVLGRFSQRELKEICMWGELIYPPPLLEHFKAEIRAELEKLTGQAPGPLNSRDESGNNDAR